MKVVELFESKKDDARSIGELIRSIASDKGLTASVDLPVFTKTGITFSVGFKPSAKSKDMYRPHGWNEKYEKAAKAATVEIVSGLKRKGFKVDPTEWSPGYKFKFKVVA